MRYIPCDTDAWTEAEKKAKRKKKVNLAPSQSSRRSAKIAKAHKNYNAR